MPAEDDEAHEYLDTWQRVHRVREYFLFQAPQLRPPTYWIDEGQKAFGDSANSITGRWKLAWLSWARLIWHY
jgi:hypothetical protein